VKTEVTRRFSKAVDHFVLLPKKATNCCRKRQQFVAEIGINLLPKSATKCCRNRQQIVASGQCGQAFTLHQTSQDFF